MRFEPHRQIVFTILKMLRVFFKFKRRLLGDFCRSALWSVTRYFEVVAGSGLAPGIMAAIQTFGDWINLYPHLYFPVRNQVTFCVCFGGDDEEETLVRRFLDFFLQELPCVRS